MKDKLKQMEEEMDKKFDEILKIQAETSVPTLESIE